MPLIIGIVNQKGGVGKTALTRLIAREYAANDWKVKIADMDLDQTRSVKWVQKRLQYNRQPEIAAEMFRSVDKAIRDSEQYDLLVFDGAPHANLQTEQIARISDLIIIPTSHSEDDLEPTVELAHKFRKMGIPKSQFVIAFSQIGESEAENREAVEYIQDAGYEPLQGGIPFQAAFRRAFEKGLSQTETPFSSLNERADLLIQEIMNRVKQLERKGELKYG